MSRLITKNYLRTHDRLRKLWLQDARLFAELSTNDQWLLHDFFKPDKDWVDVQLLQHRAEITKQRPNLPPRQAGLLERFWPSSANAAVQRVRKAK